MFVLLGGGREAGGKARAGHRPGGERINHPAATAPVLPCFTWHATQTGHRHRHPLHRLFTIEISKSYTTTEWREDLKRVMRQAGGAGTATVFLFSDSQLKDESFLEVSLAWLAWRGREGRAHGHGPLGAVCIEVWRRRGAKVPAR